MERKSIVVGIIFTRNSTFTIFHGALDWVCSTSEEISSDLNTTWRGFLQRFRFGLMMISTWKTRPTSERSASAARATFDKRQTMSNERQTISIGGMHEDGF